MTLPCIHSPESDASTFTCIWVSISVHSIVKKMWFPVQLVCRYLALPENVILLREGGNARRARLRARGLGEEIRRRNLTPGSFITACPELNQQRWNTAARCRFKSWDSKLHTRIQPLAPRRPLEISVVAKQIRIIRWYHNCNYCPQSVGVCFVFKKKKEKKPLCYSKQLLEAQSGCWAAAEAMVWVKCWIWMKSKLLH